MSPLLAGAAGLQAYLDNQALTIVGLITVFWFAMTALALNQWFAFWRAHNVEGRLVTSSLTILRGAEPDSDVKGYVLQVPFVNMSATTLEYEVTEFRFELDERISREKPFTSGTVVPPGLMARHGSGVVALGFRPNAIMKGRLFMTYSYGRVGKLRYSGKLDLIITTHTNAEADIISIQAMAQRKKD